MDRATAILLTLIAYKIVLLLIGLLAQRLTRNEADFFLGGRRLGPLVASISANASSSSVWTLLGVSGFAYLNGLSALWLFPACVGGFALNWFLVAPRLRQRCGTALTVTELFAGPPGRPGRRAIVWLASIIVLASLMTYVAAQFRGAGDSFVQIFELDRATSILIGAGIVVAYTLLGGFFAVSITDTLQGLMMAGCSVVLPVAALIHIGGFGALADGLQQVDQDDYLSLTRGMAGPAAFGFVLGLLGIGLGYPGQPHSVVRFMALRSESDVARARLYGMTWAVLVYAGMIIVGLSARLVVTMAPGDHEKSFYALTDALFPPVVAGVMIAAVLSAIMSTADSQLLVAASTVSHDLGAGGADPRKTLRNSRLVVLALSIGAVLAAMVGTETIFDKVLFAWSAMGAAFGPLMLVFLWRGPVATWATLAAMTAGASLSIFGYYTRYLGGGVEERVLPWIVALVLAALGSVPRREGSADGSRQP